jgi:hypothetical protein
MSFMDTLGSPRKQVKKLECDLCQGQGPHQGKIPSYSKKLNKERERELKE